ncbi:MULTISPECIES: hypothetical protein [Cupriavidus]|uniref:Uncharacterized protein n=1 Tax=Cupriavidus pinatubonensis (strain JMP 134 / LMG 1197) TaxID=264198 RepID=Q46QV3_CUPPJ|nr:MULTISPECIES: hypothetical protein [Cupriavidus]QYY27871.1 hypothetical protein K2O51_08055 [Cupriavidus pinatubonensis]TPQ41585.1 hypothetical protein C2U69_07040 [Cupriavidus pinatubonensis]
MLSHHEFATLVLVNGSPDSTELDRADIEALLARQLVTLERLGPDRSRPHVTIQGYVVLKALDRSRAHDCRARETVR